MEIIPAIYISRGKAISLYKGRNNEERTVYNKSPLNIAKMFAKHGLNKLHIVDVDGSFEHKFNNKELLCKIVTETSAEVQIAGGIRTMAEIEELFSCGIKRVVLGYSAKGIFKEAIAKYGEDRIYGGIKAKRNIIDTDFPLEKPLEVLHAGEEYQALGIKNIVLKDLEAEGTFMPNFDEIDRLISFTGLNLYLSGGISKDSHLKIAKQINVKGVIIGRAFMEGMLGVQEAVEISKS